MADESVFIRFGGSIENLTAAVDGARASIESLAAPFTGLQSAFGGLGAALAGAFAVHEIAHFTESMAALGLETSRASQILGIGVQEIGGLKLIAAASGGSLEELQHAFGRLSKAVIEESDPAKRALAALGLSFADIRNLTPEAQLELLATKFASIKDGADKDAIAIALLGRAGQEMIPLFNHGAEEMKHWADLAQELGVTLDETATQKMESMHGSLIELNAAFEGLKIGAFLQMQSSIEGVSDAMVDFVKWLRNTHDAEGGAATGASVFSTAVKGISTLFVDLLAGFKNFLTLSAAGWNDAKSVVNHYGEAVKDIFRQFKDEDIAALQSIWDKAKEATAGIRAEFEAIVAPISTAFSKIATFAADKFHEMVASAQSYAPQMSTAFSSFFKGGVDFRHALDEIKAGNKEMADQFTSAMAGIAATHQTTAGQVARI